MPSPLESTNFLGSKKLLDVKEEKEDYSFTTTAKIQGGIFGGRNTNLRYQ
jgi:hypothetical protein